MDPVTMITTAVIAGATLVGKKVLDKGTDELWNRLMTLLRGKAEGDEQASTALAKADDAEAVTHAVQTTNAAADPEIMQAASQIIGKIPHDQSVQIAKQINNINNAGGTINQTF